MLNLFTVWYWLPRWLSGKESAFPCRRCMQYKFNRSVGKIPWRRKWQPTQCSCLENPRDREARWAAVYGVAQSRTRLKQLSSQYSCLDNSMDRGAWHATAHGVTKSWTRLNTHTHTHVPLLQTYHNLWTRSPTDGHLDSFQFLAVKSKATVGSIAHFLIGSNAYHSPK